MVTLKVDGTVIKQKGSYQAVADSVNYFVLDFVFSEEWLACDSIVVSTTSRADENLSYNQMLEGNSYRVPGSMMRHPGFTLGLVGYDVDGNVKITTQSYEIAVKKTGFNKDAAEPGAEQMSAFDQVMDELGKMKKAFKYVHIKWADMEPTSNAGVDMVDTPAEWMGIYCGNEEKEAPTDCMKYKWYKVKGEKGDRGDAFTYDDFTEEQLEKLVADKADVDLSNVQAEGLTLGYKNIEETLNGYLPNNGLNLCYTKKANKEYSEFGNIVSKDSIAAGASNLLWSNGRYIKVSYKQWDTPNHQYKLKFENFEKIVGTGKVPQIGACVVITQDLLRALYVMPIIAYDESTGLVTCSYNPELSIWYASSNNPHIYIENPDTIPSSKGLALGTCNTVIGTATMSVGNNNLGHTSSSLMVGNNNQVFNSKSRAFSSNSLLVGENNGFDAVLKNSLVAGSTNYNLPEDDVVQVLNNVFLFGEGLTPYSDQCIIGSWNDPDETKAFIIANEANIFAVDRQGGVVAKGNVEATGFSIGSTNSLTTKRGVNLEYGNRMNLISDNAIVNGCNNFVHPYTVMIMGNMAYDAETRTVNITGLDISDEVSPSINDVVYLYWQNTTIYQKPIKATISAFNAEARTMSVSVPEEALPFPYSWLNSMYCVYVDQNTKDFDGSMPCLVIGNDNCLSSVLHSVVLGKNNFISSAYYSIERSIINGTNMDIIGGMESSLVLGNKHTLEFSTVASSIIAGSNIYISNESGDNTTTSKSYSYNLIGGSNHSLMSGASRGATWGSSNIISGNTSFAFGNRLIANSAQFVIGKYNQSDSSKLFIIGGGQGVSSRANLLTVDLDGNMSVKGNVTVGNNPVSNMDVATKEYVDETVACNVSKAGDTMEGPLIAHSDMNYSTSKVRNIGLTTGVPTSIPNGEIVGVYIA